MTDKLATELSIYDLQHKYDEFKDLSFDQLMKIGELCLAYYNKGLFNTFEDVNSDLQDEIDELNNKLDELEDANHDLYYENNELEELVKECYLAKDMDDMKEAINNYAEIHKNYYKWSDWLDKK